MKLDQEPKVKIAALGSYGGGYTRQDLRPGGVFMMDRSDSSSFKAAVVRISHKETRTARPDVPLS